MAEEIGKEESCCLSRRALSPDPSAVGFGDARENSNRLLADPLGVNKQVNDGACGVNVGELLRNDEGRGVALCSRRR